MSRRCSGCPPGPVDLTRDRRPTPRPASTATRPTARRRWPRSGAELADLQERLFAERHDRARSAGCCWCCRAWTPPARAACCATPSDWSTRRASGSPRSRRRPRRSAPTTSCGGSSKALPEPGLRRGLRPLPLRGRADRAGPRAGADPRRSSAATARSTTSRRGSSTTAPRSSSACSTSPPTSRRSGCWPGSTTRQALEVQPRRHRRAGAVAGVPRGLRDRARAHQHRERRPWHVIPADKKWFRNLAIGDLLLDDAARPRPAVAGAPTSTSRPSSERLADEEPDRVIPTVAVTRYVTPLREGGILPGHRRGRRPRHLRLQVPRRRPGPAGAGRRGDRRRARRAGSGCAPRGWWRSTSTRRSPATRPTRRSRTCSTPAPGSTSASTSCPARSATTATLPGRATGRGRPGALARRVQRQRRPHLAQPQPAALARRPVGDRPRRRRSTSTTAGPAASATRRGSRPQPWDAGDHVLRRVRRRAGRASTPRSRAVLAPRRVRRGARRGAGRLARAGPRAATPDAAARGVRRLPASPGSAPGSGCRRRRRHERP